MTGNIKIGVVPYMNAKPLIYGLEQKKNSVELHYAVPALLPQMLIDDYVDVAMIPSIEYFRKGSLAIIPEIAITSQQAVESVKIFSKVPLKDIKTVALDKNSLTSRTLTKIILSKRYHISPGYTHWNNRYDISSTECDAVLLIGDNAMKVTKDRYESLDLGQAWYEYTWLPFVYAVWAVKHGRKIHGLNKLLKSAKENGVHMAKLLARDESIRLGLSQETCYRYLTESISYDFGENEIKGLSTFYKHAVDLELAPEGMGIIFNDT